MREHNCKKSAHKIDVTRLAPNDYNSSHFKIKTLSPKSRLVQTTFITVYLYKFTLNPALLHMSVAEQANGFLAEYSQPHIHIKSTF